MPNVIYWSVLSLVWTCCWPFYWNIRKYEVKANAQKISELLDKLENGAG